MNTDLVEWVADRLKQSDLDDDAGLVVLAALESDEELDECLATESRTTTTRSRPGVIPPEVDSNGVFLKSITVEGFRGIGSASTLEVKPTPGLTIVAGRNGSGKSSFAEALELVLTGGTYRWQQKSAQWKEHWRNLHHPDPVAITVRVFEEQSGLITLSARWEPGADDVEDRTARSQRAGQKQQEGTASLGWQRPLDRFRPILSYDELGGLLEGSPSELYDAIANVLGVGQLSDGLKRIQTRLKDRKAPEGVATKKRKELHSRASVLADERAVEAAKGLKHTTPDVAALRALATGVATVDHGPLPTLRALASLTAPSTPEETSNAAKRLRGAVAGLAAAGIDASARRYARLEVLEKAIAIHRDHGDMTCPVCRGRNLDDTWASTSSELATAERRALRGVETARQSLDVALASARRLLAARPAALDVAPVPELEAAVGAARDAWNAWSEAPKGSDAQSAQALADHLELYLDELVTTAEAVRIAATETLSARDDVWEPLATQIAAWCEEWGAWIASKPSVDMLGRAEAWLKRNDIRLKNERLEPIRVGAREAWSRLRQESNVELGNLTLEGAATRRRVKIDSTVDGADAGSLAVLSQGELHALALALFLPRATMAESPFRFLVLDDPVQAMDPAKVDGLVELLTDLAQDRQVIVFSHDDRLPAAVRRSRIDATIVEVMRGKGSEVTVRPAGDPAARYLADAFALLKDQDLPDATLRRALPGLLRFAVESAARDRYFAEQIKAGKSLREIEATWAAVTATRDRVSLAIYGDVRSLDGWAGAPYRKFGLSNVASSMHKGLRPQIDPWDAARHVERLVQDVQAGAK